MAHGTELAWEYLLCESISAADAQSQRLPRLQLDGYPVKERPDFVCKLSEAANLAVDHAFPFGVSHGLRVHEQTRGRTKSQSLD